MPDHSPIAAARSALASRPATPRLNPASPLQRLLDGPVRPGSVRWIGVRPARHAPMLALDQAILDPAAGLVGDHYSGGSGARQVSLIAAESLRAIAAFLGRETVAPESLRRNVVVAGINLLALKGRHFLLGEALLECTGECHPCSRLETLLGPGGYNAVRGGGGILARVLQPGAVRLGNPVSRVES